MDTKPPLDGDVLAESGYARVTREGAELAVEVFEHRNPRVARFPETDECADDAWELFHRVTRQGRLGRALNVIAVVAVVAGTVWLLVAAIDATLWLRLYRTQDDQVFGALAQQLQVLEGFANALFFATTGIYGVTWLYRRGIPNNTR